MQKNLFRTPSAYGLTKKAQDDIARLDLDPERVIDAAARPDVTYPGNRSGQHVHKALGLSVVVDRQASKIITVGLA